MVSDFLEERTSKVLEILRYFIHERDAKYGLKIYESRAWSRLQDMP